MHLQSDTVKIMNAVFSPTLYAINIVFQFFLFYSSAWQVFIEICYMAGTILSIVDIAVSKTGKTPALVELVS